MQTTQAQDNAKKGKKANFGDVNQQRSINVFMILSSVSVFFVNNTVFVYSSQFMYTINLFVETLSFLYMAKYFEYDGSDTVAFVM